MPPEAMDAIFTDFTKLLEYRFNGGILTTEDSVRHCQTNWVGPVEPAIEAF